MTREQDIERIAAVLAAAGPFGRWLPSGKQRYLTDADMAAALYDAGLRPTEGDAAPGGTVGDQHGTWAEHGMGFRLPEPKRWAVFEDEDGVFRIVTDEDGDDVTWPEMREADCAAVVRDHNILVQRLATPPVPRDEHPDETLDVAWAAAEAALPEGWCIDSLGLNPDGTWQVFYSNDSEVDAEVGPTPAAALLALAARLKES